MPARGLVLSGARMRLMLEGVKVAYATNVNYSEEIQRDPVEVLDQLEVAEHVAVRYRATLSAQWVRLVSQPIKLREGVTIMPTLDNILSQAPLTATLEDSVTGSVAANITQVEATRYSVAIGATGIVLTDAEFVAIRIQDESEIV